MNFNNFLLREYQFQKGYKSKWISGNATDLLNMKIMYDIITDEANAKEVVRNATEISGIEGEFWQGYK